MNGTATGMTKRSFMKPFRLNLAQRMCRSLPPLISQRIRSLIYPDDRGRLDNCSLKVKAQTGSVMEGSTRDYHFQKFAVHGFYDWRNVAVCLALVSTGDNVVEVGANIGTETISFADIVGPNGKVHAFEPLPSHIATLSRLNRLSLYKNIVVHEFALSNEKGVASFVPPMGEHNGVGHLRWESELDKGNSILVSVTTLDLIAEEIGFAKLIVTDIEGEEYNFLVGARDYLKRYRPFLLMEAAPPLLRFKGQSIRDQYETLLRFDYEVFAITRLGLELVRDASLTPDRQNWVCFPREQRFLADKVRKTLWQCGLAPFVWNLNPLRCPRKGTG
jgi:FkbM family methyltransferase